MSPQEEKDFKIYCFEQAMHIIENSTQIYTKDTIDDIFSLSDKIYKYLNT